MAAASELPFVDELSVEIAAGSEPSWEALLRVVEGSFASARGRHPARLLGCEDLEPAGPRPLAAGSTFPGFHVEATEPPRELALAGRHRFSAYALTFRLDDRDGATALRAETRAAFPGIHGRIYRALVIGTRMHVLVTRRLLAATKRRAERA
jgi:hypothetical protein